MIKKILSVLSILFISSAALTAQNHHDYSEMKNEESLNIPGIYAKMETTRGVMIFYLDYKNTPLTTLNFINLAEKGFYDGLTFYRDIQNYAIFSGDPLNNGSSDAGYNFPMEINNSIKHDKVGILSMDGVSNMSNSSRFFVSKSQDAVLDDKYTAFGFITEGLNILEKLKRKDIINSIKIIRTGSDAMAFNTEEREFNRLSQIIMEKELDSFRTENPDVVAAIESMGEGVKKTLTGIYYNTTLEGNNIKPKKKDGVSVHYVGKMVDGTIFDSSIARGVPFEFTVGTKSVISGWDESILDMSVGEKRTIIIPPNLAYGNAQAGPIPPDSWLLFEVELIGIK